MAGTRLYVQKGVAAEFKKQFLAAFGTFVHGDPADPNTTLGPQADEVQNKIVMSYLDIGNKEGKAEIGGTASKSMQKGYFIEPTIFSGVPHNSRINQEEVFGPVATIFEFETEEEAVRMANESECESSRSRSEYAATPLTRGEQTVSTRPSSRPTLTEPSAWQSDSRPATSASTRPVQRARARCPLAASSRPVSAARAVSTTSSAGPRRRASSLVLPTSKVCVFKQACGSHSSQKPATKSTNSLGRSAWTQWPVSSVSSLLLGKNCEIKGVLRLLMYFDLAPLMNSDGLSQVTLPASKGKSPMPSIALRKKCSGILNL